MHNLEKFKRQVTATCVPVEARLALDALLNARYNFNAVGGPFVGMNVAQVLRIIDPLIYQMELNQYLKDELLLEIDGKYYTDDAVMGVGIDFVESLRFQAMNAPSGEEGAIERANLHEDIEQIRAFCRTNACA